MQLFNLNNYKEITSQNVENIETPLGEIKFNLTIEDYEIALKKPTNLYQLSNNNKIYSWDYKAFKTELLICYPKINLPKEMHVDNCIAGAWRLKALDNISTCVFSCKWTENKRWSDVTPNSGEYLDAQTWEGLNKYVTIGTEDGEYLVIRAMKNDMIPAHLIKEVNTLDLVKYFDDGLMIPITRILKDDILQIHFVISWAHNEISTWYAVGIPSQDILKTLD